MNENVIIAVWPVIAFAICAGVILVYGRVRGIFSDVPAVSLPDTARSVAPKKRSAASRDGIRPPKA